MRRGVGRQGKAEGERKAKGGRRDKVRNVPFKENRERPQNLREVEAIMEDETQYRAWAEKVFDAKCVD